MSPWRKVLRALPAFFASVAWTTVEGMAWSVTRRAWRLQRAAQERALAADARLEEAAR